jgi:UDP-GlcNAc:undecaprenyl-phosphate GlcNAc-1-phosphate transferase
MGNLYFLLLYPTIILIFILISRKLKFVDKPNSRKIHTKPVINTSGIAIYFFLLIIISLNEFSYELETVIAIGLLIALIGFIDDRINLTPGVKLFFKSLPVIYLILNGFNLNDLGDYELIDIIHLGKFNFVFTFLAAMLLINAFNYIDGIDGLLIGVTITASLYFIILSDKSADYVTLFLYFIYALIFNLILNVLPKNLFFKCFSGNTGSLFFGFFISFSMIYLYKYENIHPALLVWACWYPVYDFLYVTFNRLINQKQFALADETHFHHQLTKYFNNNQYKSSIIINSSNIVIVVVGYLIGTNLGKIFSLVFFIILFYLFVILRKNFLKE